MNYFLSHRHASKVNVKWTQFPISSDWCSCSSVVSITIELKHIKYQQAVILSMLILRRKKVDITQCLFLFITFHILLLSSSVPAFINYECQLSPHTWFTLINNVLCTRTTLIFLLTLVTNKHWLDWSDSVQTYKQYSHITRQQWFRIILIITRLE